MKYLPILFVFSFVLLLSEMGAGLSNLDPDELATMELSELRDVVVDSTEIVNQLFDFNKFGIILPLSIEVTITDANFTLYILVEESGVRIVDVAEPDIIIQSTEDNMRAFFQTGEDEILNQLQTVDVIASSFKGKLAAQFAEDYFDVKLVKNKSFGQSILRILTVPLTGIISWFN